MFFSGERTGMTHKVLQTLFLIVVSKIIRQIWNLSIR